MSVLDFARQAVDRILTDSEGFTTSVVFLAPDSTTCTIQSLAVKHNLKFDEYGTPISSKTARITVSEASLVAAEFPVRNAANEVYLNGVLVTWTDSAGIEWTYVIQTAAPDESLGCILCQISDYQAATP